MIIPSALMGVTDFIYVAGVSANPTSITAVLYRWVGATRSASGVSVTPIPIGGGEYQFTWTNNVGWDRTDELELVALPVVSGVTYPATIWRSHGSVDAVMRGTDGANTTTPPPVGDIADQVWDEATSGHTTSGTYGGRIVRATNSNVEVQITGSNHIAADVHELQAGVITSGDFAANSITASALAADAVAEIQSGLATAANLLIVLDGVGFITSALMGTISDAGTAGETYVIAFGGSTYTLDYTGLDTSGNRTGVTRTKT